MNIPFEITKEELVAAAAKQATETFPPCELDEVIRDAVRDKVKEEVSKSLKERIDTVLAAELEAILTRKITPCDMWGEPNGEPSTIRDQLFQKALTFWGENVDEAGKKNSWGEPRYQRLMRSIVKEGFEKVVRDNADVVVAAFKKSLVENGKKVVEEHINRLIK